MPEDRLVVPALGALWSQRGELRLAWDVLRHGACGDCSLGVLGLRDPAGAHVCARRLRELDRFTAAPVAPSTLHRVDALPSDPKKLRRLGRLGSPLLRRAGDDGFTPLSWEDAAALAASRLRDARSGASVLVRVDPEGLDLESLGQVARVAARLERRVPDLGLALPAAERALRLRAREELGHASGDLGPEDLQPGDVALLVHDGSVPLVGRLEATLRDRGVLLRVAGPADPWPDDVRGVVLLGRAGTSAALAAGLPLGAEPAGTADAAWLVGEGATADATVRVHQATFLAPAMLAPAAEAVLLLPAVPPSEDPAGGSVLSDDLVVRFSPPTLGAHPTGARTHQEIATRILAQADPLAATRIAAHDAAELRVALSAERPLLGGLVGFRSPGDLFRLPTPVP